jgi:hypothetical protein
MMTFLPRWLAALAVVTLAWNPSGWNFTAWARANYASQTSLVVLAGLVLATLIGIGLVATWRSIGLIGVLTVTALLGAALWVLTDFGLISITRPGPLAWIVLFGLSLILGLGLTWSHVQKRLTGRTDVDETEA